MEYGGAEGLGGAHGAHHPIHGHHHHSHHGSGKTLGALAHDLHAAGSDKHKLGAVREELGHKLNDPSLTPNERKAVQQALHDINAGRADKAAHDLDHMEKK